MDAYVVTGGGRGIGPAIAERLAATGTVVAVELHPAGLDRVDGSRVRTTLGREPQP
jgi:NAD(P)-dependent dehydrogenase (short-subunit alcohol dehydrogenase family)